MHGFKATLAEHIDVVCAIDAVQAEALATATVDTLKRSRKIMACGNGGSAADAQHFAAELVVRFETDRKGLPAIALTTDTSAVTAAANDFGYEKVFARAVEALACPGDALFCLSTSGRSRNVLLALRAARTAGVRTLAITGEGEGPIFREADLALTIPGLAARVQEGTILVLHHIAAAVDAAF